MSNTLTIIGQSTILTTAKALARSAAENSAGTDYDSGWYLTDGTPSDPFGKNN